MKTKFLSVIILAIISLSLHTVNANAGIKTPLTDTVCCGPDSLKVLSTNFPVFCVSWHVRSDSGCRVPYGFEVQWRYFPSSNPWTGAVVTYTGGTTVSFCARVDTCRSYQWRVRAICDSINGGHYSDWVYGNKIGMNCPVARNAENDLINDAKMPAGTDKTGISPMEVKPKEQD